MNKHKFEKLTTAELAYLAGFLDGDGCILAQIVKGRQYRYKHTIRVGVVLYQRKDKHWFFIQLQKKLGLGSIRIRNDNMVEYAILGPSPVKALLELLIPFLILKKNVVILLFRIIDKLRVVQNEADFIEVCHLVDKVAEHTYSKKRQNTATIVKETLALPVETEK